MTMVLKLEHVSKEWQEKPIFTAVDLDISVGERIALIGKNGVGKTSLLSGIMGHTMFNSGIVKRGVPSQDYGWLQQKLSVDPQVKLFDFVFSKIQESLPTSDFNRSGHISETHASLRANIQKQLRRLGLTKDIWDVPYVNLSGGEKTKTQLVLLTLQQPKFLILDEPTNHLDVKSLEWLEHWLCRYPGTVLFVSHDRQFIDHVATATVELTPTGAKRYNGGYTTFCEQRALELETQRALFDKQQQERRQLMESIQTYRNWWAEKAKTRETRDQFDFNRKSTQNKHRNHLRAKEHALERLEQRMVEQPTEEATFRVDLGHPHLQMQTLIRLEQMTFGYDARMLMTDVNLDVRRGERIAVIGQNGIGKTTFLKLLTGDLSPTSGEIKRHPALFIGYLDQELLDVHPTETLLGTISNMPGMTIQRACSALAGYLFESEDWGKCVADLSMGERCRLSLLRMALSEVNVLILDEPTNYLDIQSRETVEACLTNYPGSLVMVSHDRYLIKKIANRVVSIENGRVEHFPGTYDEWLQRRDRKKTGLDIETENRIQQLELRLTQYMTQSSGRRSSRVDNAARSDDGMEILQRIQEIQDELKQLRSKRAHS
jgi:ATPase subunit of ABC transporter with duplicated ATPase domains